MGTGEMRTGAVRRRNAIGIGMVLPALVAAACQPGETTPGGGALGPMTKEAVTLRLMQRAEPEEQYAHTDADEFS